jgi:hypothetical protein
VLATVDQGEEATSAEKARLISIAPRAGSVRECELVSDTHARKFLPDSAFG